MGGEARRKVGLSRALSVDSFNFSRSKGSEKSKAEKDKGVFEIRSIRYKTYPKNYKEVPEDIWHWVPLPPEDTNVKIVSNKNKNELYMKTLTYKDIEDLDLILLNKMR